MYKAIAAVFLFSYAVTGGLILMNLYHVTRNWRKLTYRNQFLLSFTFILPCVWMILATGTYFPVLELNGAQVMAFVVLANFYVMALQVLWRFTEFRSDGLKNEIDSFAFNKEQLKIDSFDMVGLKEQKAEDGSTVDQGGSVAQSDGTREADSSAENKAAFSTHGVEDQPDQQHPASLWIGEGDPAPTAQPRQETPSGGYETFEDSPYKDKDSARLPRQEDILQKIRFDELEQNRDMSI